MIADDFNRWSTIVTSSIAVTISLSIDSAMGIYRNVDSREVTESQRLPSTGPAHSSRVFVMEDVVLPLCHWRDTHMKMNGLDATFAVVHSHYLQLIDEAFSIVQRVHHQRYRVHYIQSVHLSTILFQQLTIIGKRKITKILNETDSLRMRPAWQKLMQRFHLQTMDILNNSWLTFLEKTAVYVINTC